MSIIHSIKTFIEEENISSDIQEAFNLYENIKSSSKIDLIYEYIKQWIYDVYKIHNIKIIITRIHQNDIIFHNGKEYNTEDELSLNFSINLNEDSSILFSFLCDNEEHFKEIETKYIYLNTIFYLITPLINTTFLEEKIATSYLKDDITGLYNRKYLLEHLEKMLPLARREHKNIAFLMIGIDHFKAVIDEFNYDIGNKVLIKLADSLSEGIRSSDIVIRFDGDQFLVVLANIDSKENAVMVAEKLIENFGKCGVDVNSYSGQVLKKSICIGVSIYPNDSTSIDQILKNSDIALYEARNKGRSEVLAFSDIQVSSIDLF